MSLKKLYLKYCNAVAFVEVENEDGDIDGGSAFHIGDGVFLTAKHVVENRRIKSIQTTTRGYYKTGPDDVEVHPSGFHRYTNYKQYDRQAGELVLGPFCDSYDDVAVFTAKGIDAPTIPLGLSSHDYMFDDDEMVLSKVLIMGYPRVAFSDGPRLVATKAEISTVIDKVSPGPPFFVISAMARGGFSGGPCLTRHGECLGLITESLMCENQTTETGFMTVLTMKPILRLLMYHNLAPGDVGDLIDQIYTNWRRPEDPVGMSPDSGAQRTDKFKKGGA